jgi:hypothetical protein
MPWTAAPREVIPVAVVQAALERDVAQRVDVAVGIWPISLHRGAGLIRRDRPEVSIGDPSAQELRSLQWHYPE